MTRSERAGSTGRKRKTDASGQALGYSLQWTRLTHMLLEAPEGAYCSLECLDDIAEHRPGEGVRLVQSKSALAANPVANRAKSLWKTLSNWLALRPGQDYPPENVIFEIYVSRPVEGKLVEAFHNATSAEQAIAAIALAREDAHGPSSGYSGLHQQA